MKWIDVRKKVPKDNSIILTFTEAFTFPIVLKFEQGMFKDIISGLHMPLVTHWMEIPHLPKHY